MPKSKSRRKKRPSGRSAHTPLNKMKRSGKTLQAFPPEMNITSTLRDRDRLPDHLWLAALFQQNGLQAAGIAMRSFLDALDPYIEDTQFPAIGFISDMGRVPPSKRSDFLAKNSDLVRRTVIEPFGSILALYPDCPGYWLLDEPSKAPRSPERDQETLSALSDLVLSMMPGRGEFCGPLRVLPMSRAIQRGKIGLPSGFVAEPFIAYPNCSEDDRKRVESFSRATLNAILMGSNHSSSDWAKVFWRTNYDLVKCFPVTVPTPSAVASEPEDLEKWREIAAGNAESASDYLTLLRTGYRPDLYDPTRDEILLGLYSRLTRLYTVLLRDPDLWARDLYSILMRCMVDTAVSFKYLGSIATEEEFADFVKYSDGKRKLLMLHLQDEYDTSISTDGASSADISSELGGFTAELLDINLGGWTKKSFRTLAFRTKMEKYYRLVYSPASEHVHGNWTSLKHANLCHCGQPLHRFHRLPTGSDPALFVNSLTFPHGLLLEMQEYAVGELNFPVPTTPFASYPTITPQTEE